MPPPVAPEVGAVPDVDVAPVPWGALEAAPLEASPEGELSPDEAPSPPEAVASSLAGDDVGVESPSFALVGEAPVDGAACSDWTSGGCVASGAGARPTPVPLGGVEEPAGGAAGGGAAGGGAAGGGAVVLVGDGTTVASGALDPGEVGVGAVAGGLCAASANDTGAWGGAGATVSATTVVPPTAAPAVAATSANLAVNSFPIIGPPVRWRSAPPLGASTGVSAIGLPRHTKRAGPSRIGP
ncbi:MAG: hypothetical protein ACYCU7_12195 [Acidimicrobiales bacterium]